MSSVWILKLSIDNKWALQARTDDSLLSMAAEDTWIGTAVKGIPENSIEYPLWLLPCACTYFHLSYVLWSACEYKTSEWLEGGQITSAHPNVSIFTFPVPLKATLILRNLHVKSAGKPTLLGVLISWVPHSRHFFLLLTYTSLFYSVMYGGQQEKSGRK